MKRILLLLIFGIGMGLMGWGQPWTYDYGTGTGSFTSSTGSTTFLPAPPTGGGTARVRVGTNPGSIAMVNPGIALGSNTELQIVSNTSSSSTTKFSVYDYTASKVGYVKFKIAFNGGTNGVYQLTVGDGATFSDNTSMATAQVFAGVQWSLLTSNAVTYKVLNAGTWGTTNINNSTTLFTQSTSNEYLIEVYYNNTSSSSDYTRSGTNYTLTTARWDLWVNGTQANSALLVSGGLGSNVNIDSYAFNHQVSATTPGTIYIDDLEYSNALPSVASITSTTSGNWADGSTWVGNVAPTATDNVVIASGHTVYTGAALTRTGTTTVNGTFQVNAGGYASGTAFTYAASGSALIMNNSSSLYGISSGQVFWPASSPPQNVTIQGSGAQLNMAVGAIPVGGALTLAAQLDATSGNPITVNGSLQLNGGGYISTTAPTYGGSSTLVYNTTYGVGTEWTGNSTTAGSGVPQNVTIQNSSTVTMPASNRGLAGNMNISSGTLALNGTSGDLYIGGNWTRVSTATFTPSNRAVFFNGSTTQTVTVSATGTATFNYLLVQGSGTLKLATGTDLTVTASSGLSLSSSHATSTIDLNGQTLTLSGGGNLSLNTGNRFITSSTANGVFKITTATTTVTNGGTLAFSATNNPIVLLTYGFDCGAGLTTINGTLQIDAGGFIANNAPKYGAASLLKYNTATTYGRGLEWSAIGTIGTTAGYPNDIQISNNTTLNAPNTGNGGADPFSTALGMARDLTIDLNSNLYMDYGGSGNKSGSLSVGRNVVINGNLSLGNALGGDMNVAGNWTRTGTFTPNSRLVTFNGASAQTLTGATTFDFLTLNNATGLTLQPSSAVIVNQTLAFTSGKLTLGANDLTIGASGTITGQSASNFIVTNSTGILKRSSVGNTATAFPVGNLTTSYTPLTITNTGTTNDISVGASASITNAVTDATKIVTLQWTITPGGTGATADITFNWNTGNQAASYNATGTGELGVYTIGPYAITSLGTMSGQSKSVTGISLANSSNLMVIGNTGAVYTAPPANDECSNAISITPGASAISGSNVAATKSSPTGLTVSAYTTGIAKDVWYTFTATCTGSHTITVTPTSFDVAIALFSGGSCPNPTYTTYADAGGSGTAENITASLTSGTTYKVLVWGYNSASGSFTIGVTPPTPVAQAVTSNAATLVTISAATLNGNVTALGVCPSTTEKGFVYSITSVNDNPLEGGTGVTKTSVSGLTTGAYTLPLASLSSGTGYSFKAYVHDGSDYTYGDVTTFTTTPLAPNELAADPINSTGFTANWDASAGAVSYRLDVSTLEAFGTPSPATFTEGFETGMPTSYTTGNATLGSGTWSLTRAMRGSTGVNSGSYSAQIESSTGASMITPSIPNGVTTISFWVTSSTSSGAMQVNYSTDGGANWTSAPGSPFTGLGTSKVQKTINLNNSAASTLIQFYRTSATIYLDDISIGYTTLTPVLLDNYNNLTVNSTSQSVTGLNPNTTYYYRVRAVGPNSTSVNSGTITVITGKAIQSAAASNWNSESTWSSGTIPRSIDDVSILSSYPVSVNLTGAVCAGLSISEGGVLTINSGMALTVNGDISNTPGIDGLIIKSDASGTGSLITTSTTGATVERYLAKDDYHYISSPVANQLISTEFVDITGAVPTTLDFYTWDETVAVPWINIKATTSTWNTSFDTYFGLCKGYVYANKAADVTKNFKGTLYSGDQEFTMSKTITPGQNGWNLIGNPFASYMAINNTADPLNNVLLNNTDAIDDNFEALYFWDQQPNYTGGTRNDYVTINNTTGASYLTPGQSFMVKAVADDAKFYFKQASRKHGTGTFYKSGETDNINRFQLTVLGPDNVYNETLLAMVPNTTNGMDAGYDARKMKGNPKIALYTHLVDGSEGDYSIQAVNQATGNFVFPVGIDANVTGIYTFRAGTMDNMEGVTVQLEDKITGLFTTLSPNAEYSFNIGSTGTINGRFYLHFKSSVGIDENIGSSVSHGIYSSGNSIYIENPGQATLEVYNMAGQRILSEEINSSGLYQTTLNNRIGYYVVRLSNATQVKVSKVFIK